MAAKSVRGQVRPSKAWVLVGILGLAVFTTGVESNLLSNFHYGAMGNETSATPITISIAASDTWYNISNMDCRETDGVTCLNNMLIADVDGVYYISYSISFGGGANGEYGIKSTINEDTTDECHAHRKLGAGGDVGNAGSQCYIRLNAGEYTTLKIHDEGSPAQDITLEDVSIVMMRVGSLS